ncbi:hypothetical protein [Paracoccus aminophilus]|uniref:Uncharacterized protein n=1 Tax=Paracoccus aminophilus JCM 7686 TaxID=1367847 RepID=S5Y1V6_PARAH|nr:hypothetical protein [Paracoccus aminophilus]AGT09710.1 hypothetical protein JCM7686_2654 [Paracoccus aminophilus JCM 7686]
MKKQRLVRQPSGDARWNRFTTAEEEQRLSVLNERIDRSATILARNVAERQTIMKRAQKRMWRAEDKA